MLTVVIVAYRRPNYLAEVLDALVACYDFSKLVSQIICTVDDAPGQGVRCLHQLYRFRDRMESQFPHIPCHVVGQQTRTGIVGNTILGMKAAFDSGADNVLMLEDDGLLSPDALYLADWYCTNKTPYVVAFGLGAHRDNRPREYGHINEYNYLTCPFAYVVKREMWKFLLTIWCTKEYHPCGWSWSITYNARFLGLKFMAPALSRCKNIGRESGENESPESWDKSQREVVVSDGAYTGHYSVELMLTREESMEISDWMLPEMEKRQSEKFPVADGDKFPGWIGFGCPPEILAARKQIIFL